MWFMIFPAMGLWWVLITLFFFIWVTIAVENDEIGWIVGGLVLWGLITGIFGDFLLVFSWLMAHPWHVLYIPIVWFALGFLYGLFRWWWDQTRLRSKYNNVREDFLIDKGIIQRGESPIGVQIPDEHLASWKVKIENSHLCGYGNGFRKHFQDERRKISMRMTMWPFSLASFLLKDFIVRAYEIVLDKTRKMFEKIEASIWKGTDDDFREPEPVIADKTQREQDREDRDYDLT